MLKKIFALAFASAVASVAFASEPTSLELQTAPAQEAVAQEATVSDVQDADELRTYASDKECKDACLAAHCTTWHFIKGNGSSGSCTCGGCTI